MKRLKKLEKTLIFVLLFLSVVLGAGLGILISAFDNTTDISPLENFRPEIPSKIYDRNGELISELFTVKRDPVTFEELPGNLINAIIAIEDSAFYEHHGIHLKRVFGALMANLRSGRIEQGASTITMQLARTLFTGREKTYSRKIKEIWLALKIEKKYSKNEILTLYFNQIYFGHGAYGIQAASQFYFNKPITDLTLAECAILAGLPQSPNRLSPLRNPRLARERQELVLERMVSEGMVTPEEAYESYQDFWVSFRLQMRSPSQSVYKLQENKAPHFVEYVRQKLEKLYGSDRIYTDGLKVYTSLDLTQQAYAEKYLTEGLNRQNEVYSQNMHLVRESIDKRFIDSLDMLSLLFNLERVNIGSYKNQERILTYLDESILAPVDMISFLFGNNDIKRIIEGSYLIEESAGEFQKVEGAIIAIEPQNGYITAMVGGSTFSEDNQINRAVQIRRQTGSGFKPYIYSAAVDTKIFTPASIIVDSPVIFYDEEEQWIPDNYSGTFRGKLRLREALRRSVNVVTAKIVDRLGVDTVIRYASSIIGITDPEEIAERFPRVYSIALGVVELSPYEQAKGFCTFANQGQEVTPIAILYVLDREGNLIDNFEAELRNDEMRRGRRQVLSEQTNYIVVDMLRDVLRPGGTGYRAATNNGFEKPAAGKTGTTQNWKDAWFTGFTPDLVASVWVGFDRNSISLGRGQAGGVVAGPIWAQFMRDATQDNPATWYSRPKGVYAITIDRNTGLLPKKGCKDIMTEYFLEGTIPTEYSTECGEVKTSDSFNIDIFNRKEESPNIFGDLPEPGITEHRKEPGVWYDSGIEDQGYTPEEEQFDGEEYGSEPSTDGDIGEKNMPSPSGEDTSPLSGEDMIPPSRGETPYLSEESSRDTETPPSTATDVDTSPGENAPGQSTPPPEEYREPMTSEL
jgi:penicillin-binding protein 1A